jgi:hypothetical protein
MLTPSCTRDPEQSPGPDLSNQISMGGNPMKVRRFAILIALAAAVLPGIATAQAVHYAFAPIANLDDYYGYLEPATITNSGDVLFAPALVTGGEGVLLWHHGAITTIAQGGETMPDGGVFGYTFSPVQMNERGDVAFAITRDGINNVPEPSGINAGVYRYNRLTGVTPVMIPRKLATPGTPAVPGTPTPGGGSFWGSFYFVSIPNNGDVYFVGLVCTTRPVSFPTQTCPEGPGFLAQGVYKADPKGKITAVVAPGDPALGESYFDFTNGPAANERGDVAFAGHIYSDTCIGGFTLGCWNSLFLRDGQSGKIIPLARIGDPSPVPGKFYTAGGTPMLNAKGDVAFMADFSPAYDFSDTAVLLYSGRKTIVIAEAGDVMPDGHTVSLIGTAGQDIAMNNAGDIVFDATLTDGTQAIYLWRRGHLSVVAKTGTITSAGVISSVDDFGWGWACTQLSINDRGQILFMARFQDGGGAMLIATPK